MRYLRVILFFFFTSIAFANPWTYRLDTSSVNLAPTFGTTPILGVGATAGTSTDLHKILLMQVDNNSTSEIEVNCATFATPPSSNAINSIYVEGNTTWSGMNNTSLGNRCYWRSVSGTISSGIILLTVWGN